MSGKIYACKLVSTHSNHKQKHHVSLLILGNALKATSFNLLG